jgi:tRNA/tmRNA/rRNA uracil-C5-methylase (TrmA/RlmC/RlmD family)
MEFSFGDETAGGPLTLGMHEKKKHHNVVRTQRCEISPKDFSAILNATERFFAENGTPFYNKREKTGCLRLWCCATASTKTRCSPIW